MNVETLGNARVDLLQEVQELRSSMTLVGFADHKAGSDIEGCEQRRCAVADIRVSPGFRMPGYISSAWPSLCSKAWIIPTLTLRRSRNCLDSGSRSERLFSAAT